MGLILDSSGLVATERQGKNAREMLTAISAKTTDTEIAVSVVTLIELAHGVARANTPSARRSGGRSFRSCKSRCPAIP